MRATRAYLAGFGTAGSIVAGCAVLFVIAGAVVAFRGWPRVASPGAPATLELGAAPAPGSRVDRRLHLAAAVVLVRPAAVRGRRTAPARRSALRSVLVSAPVRSGGGAASRHTPRPGAPPSAPTGVTGSSGGGSGSGGGGSGNGGVITVSVPTNPPITVTVPTPPVKIPIPTTPVGKVLGTVTSTAGKLVGTVAGTVSKVVGGAG